MNILKIFRLRNVPWNFIFTQEIRLFLIILWCMIEGRFSGIRYILTYDAIPSKHLLYHNLYYLGIATWERHGSRQSGRCGEVRVRLRRAGQGKQHGAVAQQSRGCDRHGHTGHDHLPETESSQPCQEIRYVRRCVIYFTWLNVFLFLFCL